MRSLPEQGRFCRRAAPREAAGLRWRRVPPARGTERDRAGLRGKDRGRPPERTSRSLATDPPPIPAQPGPTWERGASGSSGSLELRPCARPNGSPRDNRPKLSSVRASTDSITDTGPAAASRRGPFEPPSRQPPRRARQGSAPVAMFVAGGSGRRRRRKWRRQVSSAPPLRRGSG